MGKITELSQGSLNGLRRQLNECIENAYNKGYADGKKEPNEEHEEYIRNLINQAKQEGYDIGLEIGKKQAISEIPEVANKENEMYDRGVEDLSKAIVWYSNLKHSERVKYIGGNLGIYGLIEDTPQKLIEGFKAYEENKQAEEEIKIGDEVCRKDRNDCKVVITGFIKEDMANAINFQGSSYIVKLTEYKRTGRHFDEVGQLLDKLKGDN